MNPDRKLADFLVSMTDEEFNKWAEDMSVEEIEKATEAVIRAKANLEQEIEECIEEELVDLSYDNCGFEDAREALSKFTLRGL